MQAPRDPLPSAKATSWGSRGQEGGPQVREAAAKWTAGAGLWCVCVCVCVCVKLCARPALPRPPDTCVRHSSTVHTRSCSHMRAHTQARTHARAPVHTRTHTYTHTYREFGWRGIEREQGLGAQGRQVRVCYCVWLCVIVCVCVIVFVFVFVFVCVCVCVCVRVSGYVFVSMLLSFIHNLMWIWIYVATCVSLHVQMYP